MATIFLQEIHKKSSDTIYNLFPIAITRLSADCADLAPEKAQNIIRTLVGFIEKDRQVEAIIERVCIKLKSHKVMSEKVE